VNPRPLLEVADIVRKHGRDFVARYRTVLSAEHLKALHAIEHCRTAVLGGHLDQCRQCGHRAISYNSCRNRNCPKCQLAASEHWLAERSRELLPVPYFHLVFTLPPAIADLARHNPALLYSLLFQASAENVLEVAADVKHLGSEVGLLSVLHTWGQNLMHHPHVHCLVPAGGIALDRMSWVRCRSKKFFLPVRVLSRVFRGKFLERLKQYFEAGKLVFAGKLAELATPAAFHKWLTQAYRQEWVVYAKRPFGSPEKVLRYLARYTHRIAISNSRLLKLENGKVTFRWKDYAHGGKQSAMTLDAVEFLRRLMLHVLPSGFVRVRYYGFFANRHRARNLSLCRRLLRLDEAPAVSVVPVVPNKVLLCPHCHRGPMQLVERLTPAQLRTRTTTPPCDSS
jgi:hypothetical protein